jgi:Gram-negative porin
MHSLLGKKEKRWVRLGAARCKGRRELVGLLKQKYLLGVATIALAIPVGAGGASAGDPQLDAVLQRLEKLERENARLKGEISKIEAKTSKPVQVKVVPAKADPKAGPNAGTSGFVEVTLPKGVYGGVGTITEPTALKGRAADDDDWYIQHKPGSNLTFQTPNGEITAYGRLNVFLQDTTPGIGGFFCPPSICNPNNGPGSSTPVGNMGWMPAIGSTSSFVGVRGEQGLGDLPFKFVYQLETSLAFSATSGIRETNAQQSNVVNGGLTTGNSWAGFAGDWGSVKAGKTIAPYENSTRSFNPFAGMLGNMGVIMGNTGGDNRDEFATLLDHSIWYESPQMALAGGKFSFAALYSPGQNRASNSDNIASGESDCTGGNSPTSGGFATCSDGAFSDAYSVTATYQTKISLGAAGFKDVPDEIGVLVTGGYERHQKVNRQSDFLGIYGAAPTLGPFLTPFTLPNATAQRFYAEDIADEDAWKVGVQFKLPTNTMIGGIFESMHRYVPQEIMFQNERQRNGTWLVVSQDITPEHNFSFGWGHAFHTPGDPGQHNDASLTTVDGAGAFAPNKNAADMLTAAWSYKFRPGWTWYIDYAATINGPSAHFDLGQGGVTTDCHDASSAVGGVGAPLPQPGLSNPHCWTGGLLQGIQTGVRWNF